MPDQFSGACESVPSTSRESLPGRRRVLPVVSVIREGRVERFVETDPTLSSAAWTGMALEEHSVPPSVNSRHEHVENFLQVILGGSGKYEVLTGGRTLRFDATPGTTFLLPRGTIDEVRWFGPTHRIGVAIQPSLLRSALTEGGQGEDPELVEQWHLMDPHISSVLVAMKTDLDDGSPAGKLYGESLANALAVYLVTRHAVRRFPAETYRGGLPGYRLRRVTEFIEHNLADEVSLEQLAAVAGMSAHYFAELFKRSTGSAPHQFVLRRRIERAKEALRNPRRSVIDAGFGAGFKNPSHFARVFRKLVGVSPSTFRLKTR